MELDCRKVRDRLLNIDVSEAIDPPSTHDVCVNTAIDFCI